MSSKRFTDPLPGPPVLDDGIIGGSLARSYVCTTTAEAPPSERKCSAIRSSAAVSSSGEYSGKALKRL